MEHHDKIVGQKERQDQLFGNKEEDFNVLQELGRGSYGIVYKVESLRHNKKVFVLKKISLDNVKLKHQKEALREVQILRKIKHPHIIRYYHSFIENEYLCILMEYAEGRDLHSLMKRHRHEGKLLAEKELWRIAYEIGLGVHYLHSNNIVHRDIKTAKYFGSNA